MMMAPAAGIGGSVLAAQPLLSSAGTLPCSRCWLRCCGRWFPVAAIGTYHLLVHLTCTAVGFAAVTRHAEQLNVGAVVGASAREGRNVVELQVGCTAAALALAAIAGKHHFLGGLRNVTALGIAAEAYQQQQEE